MTLANDGSPPAVVLNPLTPYYFDAVKILGTGNSTGLFGAIVALYYFNGKGEPVQFWIKLTAVPYLLGICFFTLAFAYLTFYSIRQFRTPPDPQGVETRRKTAVVFGALSFISWWAGTLCAARVLYLIW